MARRTTSVGSAASDDNPADEGIIAGADIGSGRDVLGLRRRSDRDRIWAQLEIELLHGKIESSRDRSGGRRGACVRKIKRECTGKIPGYRERKCRRLGRPLINVQAGLDRTGDIRNRNSINLARQRVIDRPREIEIGSKSIGDGKFISGISRKRSANLDRRCIAGGGSDGDAPAEVDQPRVPDRRVNDNRVVSERLRRNITWTPSRRE